MVEWNIGGFKITMYKADHSPLHCHVRKDGKFIGKFNLETGRWLAGQSAGQRGHCKMEAGKWNLANFDSSTSVFPATAP